MRQADIGKEGFEGADYFHFRIVTPKRLMRWLEEDRIVNGRYTFVVDNLKIVEDEINKVLQSCEGSTWEDVALAISRHLKWEYDV
ncbi:Imm8 family immunity protein [Paenibacillus peoriae]|uniref:Imm8 family immunity protein n=1 Tax=Paenibacillus peoriae TaxID=59893 RepID=UPI002116952F|nr:Imm8 family immunity protein [Paenibacillus peoriae]